MKKLNFSLSLGSFLIVGSLLHPCSAFSQNAYANVTNSSIKVVEQSYNIVEGMKDLKLYGLENEGVRYELAYQGIDSIKLKEIQVQTNLDVKKVFNEFENAYYDLDALIYDGIVKGKIADIRYDSSKSTCFRTELIVHIYSPEQFLKVPKELDKTTTTEIVILRPYGPVEGGSYQGSFDNYTYQKGEEYLFFLSKGYLEYFVQKSAKHCQKEYASNYFLVSENSPHFRKDGKIEYFCPDAAQPQVSKDISEYKTEVFDKVMRILGILSIK